MIFMCKFNRKSIFLLLMATGAIIWHVSVFAKIADVDGGVHDLSAEEVAVKFDKADNINDNYKLVDSQLIKEADDKNDIETRIGNDTGMEFTPDFKFSRWNGEVSFEVIPDIGGLAVRDKQLVFDGNDINFKTPSRDYIIYDLEKVTGEKGFEFAMLLKEKPQGNVLEENIDSEGLDFFPQPALNEESQNDGLDCTATECRDIDGQVVRSRPEDIVDSIAVYAIGKSGDYSFAGGLNYGTGKVAHIKRIKAVDAAGDWVYCKQNIDVTEKKWRVTCDQSFFDSAAYPVFVDPTIGYTTIGASNDSGDANIFLANSYSIPSHGITTGMKIAAWSAATTHVKMAIYNSSGSPSTLVGNSSTGELAVTRTLKPTQDSEWISGNNNAFLSSGSNYWLAFNTDSNSLYIAYDSTSSSKGMSSSYSSFPLASMSGSFVTYLACYSIYATYSAPSPASCVWTGSVSTAWAEAGNWSSCNDRAPLPIDSVTIGVAANQPSITAATTIASLTINNSGVLTLNGGSLTVSGVINLAGGIINANSYTINCYGTLTINNGTFNAGTGTMVFGGSWGITIISGSLSFANLNILQSSGSPVNYNFSVSGVMSVANGAVLNPANRITFTGGSISNSGSLTFRDLVIDAAGTFSVNGNISVSNTLTINSGAVLVPSAASIISGLGTLTGSGTLQVTRTAATADFATQYTIGSKVLANLTVEYTGTATQTINAFDYGNLSVKPSADNINDSFAAGLINVGGNLVVGNGVNSGTILNAGVNDPDINIAGDMIINLNATFTGSDNSARTLNIGGDLTINGTFNAPTGTNANSFTLAGDFVNNGVFNHSFGRLTLNGNNDQSLTGATIATTFYQLYGAAGGLHNNFVYAIPNAAGSQTSIPSVFPMGAGHWTAVDDPANNPDDSSSYVYDLSSGNELLDLYGLPDQALSGTISNVQVFARYSGYDAASAGRVDPTVRTYGSVYRGGGCSTTLNRTWVDCSKNWTANPNTGIGWTWDEINDLQIGAYEDCTGNYATYLTQIYAKIYYNTTVPARSINFAAGNHYAVAANGALDFSGTESAILTLGRSGSSGAWYLDVNNTNTTVAVSYVSVSWSDASGGKQILATNGTNTSGGNNANWIFSANTAPSFLVAPSDGNSATTTPSRVGSNVNFTVTANDAESNSYYLAVCKTAAITANNDAAPTCAGGAWCVSEPTVSGIQAACSYNIQTSDAESNEWFAFVCDHNSSSLCSLAGQGSGNGGSPFAVDHAPVFNAIGNTEGAIALGESVVFDSFSSDSDLSGGADAVILYVCKTADFTGSACGAGGEWCHSSAVASDPSCTYAVGATDGNATHAYYGYIVDNHFFAAANNPRLGTFTTDVTPPEIGNLVDDTIPKKNKIWIWSGASGDTFRYLIDRDNDGIPRGVYSDATTATQAGGDGTYYLHVQSKDDSGNESGIVTVSAILDNTIPVISNVDNNSNPEAVAISWMTNEAATSLVEYGLSQSYGDMTSEIDSTTRVTTHQVILPGLSPCTVYHYRVHSKDQALNEAVGVDKVFLTTGCRVGGQSSSIQVFAGGTRQQLIAKVQYLREEIARLQNLLVKKRTLPYSCAALTKDLYYGLEDDLQVRCLQEFLASQGENIYIHAVTGYYGEITRNAVKKFQIKHAAEILKPYGLSEGNGFAGLKTRSVINKIMQTSK